MFIDASFDNEAFEAFRVENWNSVTFESVYIWRGSLEIGLSMGRRVMPFK
jgi:hypothetical protein